MHVGLNLNKPLTSFQRDLAGHQTRLRTVLRSLEDGSFENRAQKARPGAVIQFQFGAMPVAESATATAACSECFLGFTRALVEFLDRLIAMRRIVARNATVPSDVASPAALNAYIGELIEAEYRDVARDQSLTNPARSTCSIGWANSSERQRSPTSVFADASSITRAYRARTLPSPITGRISLQATRRSPGWGSHSLRTPVSH